MRAAAGAAALVLALLAGGCGMVEDVAPPAPGNISGIQRRASPNTYLAGPAGFVPTPDLQTRRFDLPSERLLAAMQGVVRALPRATALAGDPARLRADYVVRGRLFGFPDVVLVQALPAAGGRSDLVLYSYSVKGYYDFGVNRGWPRVLLTALDEALVRSSSLDAFCAISSCSLEKFGGQVRTSHLYGCISLSDRLLRETVGFDSARRGRACGKC